MFIPRILVSLRMPRYMDLDHTTIIDKARDYHRRLFLEAWARDLTSDESDRLCLLAIRLRPGVIDTSD